MPQVTEENFLATEIGEQMLARLEWITMQPKVIVDMGGHDANLLKKRYPQASILRMDIAYRMLQLAKLQEKNLSENFFAEIADQSIDMVFANLFLSWCNDIETLLRECRRVLRPEGLLLFTSLGPDTLAEWRQPLAEQWLPNLIDMHDIGDMLTRNKFADPVMDVEYVTVRYRDLNKLFQELQASGMVVSAQVPVGIEVLQNPDGVWTTTYEIVHGHAWGAVQALEQTADEFGTVKFPLSHLRRKK